MTNTELVRLNRIIGDSLGRNPQSEPLFKWMRTEDVLLPVLVSTEEVLVNGIWRPEAKYEWQPTYDPGQWVFAKWHFTEPQQWVDSFGIEVPWPQYGMYYVTDALFPAGVEPHEELTYDLINAVKQSRVMSISDHLYGLQDKREKLEKQGRDMVYDYICSKASSFDNIPGKRGGVVSFGGI